MTEEELRDRLGAWARPIESIPAPDIEVIRRRAGRRVRRVAAAVVASAAVAGLVLGVAVPRLIAGAGPAPAVRTRETGWQPASPLLGPGAGPASAPFLVVLDLQRAGSPAVVYRPSEQQPRPRPVATVRMPGRSATFTDVAVAADDRTFLLTGTSRSGRSLVTRYFELRLRPDGKVGRLAALALRLPGPPTGGLGISALSPDGTRFAIAAQTGGPATIDVVSLATGAVRTWVAPGRAGQIGSLSWDSSRQLAFMWTAPGSGPHRSAGARHRPGDAERHGHLLRRRLGRPVGPAAGHLVRLRPRQPQERELHALERAQLLVLAERRAVRVVMPDLAVRATCRRSASRPARPPT